VGTGALQLKTVPVGAANQIIIAFDDNVEAHLNDLIVKGKDPQSGTVTNFTNASIVPSSPVANQFTWTTTQTFPTAMMHLRLLSGFFDARDDAGNDLDGEWDNPTSVTDNTTVTDTFPSGNGTAGGDFTFSFTTLLGDADRTNAVGIGDLNAVRNNYGITVGATWAQGDHDGDGDVDLTDLNYVRNHYGDAITTAWDGSGGAAPLSAPSGPANDGPAATSAKLLAARDAILADVGEKNITIAKDDAFWLQDGTQEWWDTFWAAIALGTSL
jgi:hypothetical protein